MRLFISLSAAALLAVLVLTACNSQEQSHPVASTTINTQPPATATNTPGDGVRRMTTVELKNLMDKGEAIVVDVRADGAWEAGHIRGAQHITTDKILAAAETLPRDKTIVTYCS